MEDLLKEAVEVAEELSRIISSYQTKVNTLELELKCAEKRLLRMESESKKSDICAILDDVCDYLYNYKDGDDLLGGYTELVKKYYDHYEN